MSVNCDPLTFRKYFSLRGKGLLQGHGKQEYSDGRGF